MWHTSSLLFTLVRMPLCRLQKATVICTCEGWILETLAFDKARAKRMRSYLTQIVELLDKL